MYFDENCSVFLKQTPFVNDVEYKTTRTAVDDSDCDKDAGMPTALSNSDTGSIFASRGSVYSDEELRRVPRTSFLNGAREKWGSVSFKDPRAAAFRQKLNAEVIGLRRQLREYNTIVKFPDHVSDDALSYCPPMFGPKWEMFDPLRHSDPDSIKILQIRGAQLASDEKWDRATAIPSKATENIHVNAALVTTMELEPARKVTLSAQQERNQPIAPRIASLQALEPYFGCPVPIADLTAGRAKESAKKVHTAPQHLTWGEVFSSGL